MFIKVVSGLLLMIYNYIPLTYSALANTHTLLQVFADYPQGRNSMLVSNRVVKI